MDAYASRRPTETAVVASLYAVLVGTLRYDNFASAYNIASFLGYNSMFILIAVGMCPPRSVPSCG